MTEEHVLSAILGATSDCAEEGNTGGGTGIICYEFKGGTGTSSRRIRISDKTFTIGVLVQANHGLRDWLTICGEAVGL